MGNYFTERLRLYGFKEVPSLAREIYKRLGSVPKGIKIYKNPNGNHELYLRGRRDLDLGKNVDASMYRKIKKHYHIMHNKGSYAHVYKEVDEIEEKKQAGIEAEKQERAEYIGKEYYKYGVKSSSGSKSPSVVVDGFKGA